MITVFLHGPEAGRTTELRVQPGQSLMQAAVAANVRGIDADCGGTMTCATCHVLVRAPHASRLPPASPDEEAMLEFTAAPRQPASRLSCQIVLDAQCDGLQVDIPPSQH